MKTIPSNKSGEWRQAEALQGNQAASINSSSSVEMIRFRGGPMPTKPVSTGRHGLRSAVIVVVAGFCCVAAQPPALPQPDVVFYGTVVRAPGDGRVTPTKVSWTLAANHETITAANTTIVQVNHDVFYLTRIAVETRQITGGPTFPACANVLELTRADTTYARSATVDFNSVVRSATLPAGKVNFIYGASRQGLAERIDLVIGETFDEWSQRIFGSLVSQSADADGDGRTNYDEFLQGTDPQSAASVSMLRGFGPAPGGGFTILWDSQAARSYTVEWTATLEAADWQPVGPPIPGTGGLLKYTHPAGAEPRVFLRVGVSEPQP